MGTKLREQLPSVKSGYSTRRRWTTRKYGCRISAITRRIATREAVTEMKELGRLALSNVAVDATDLDTGKATAPMISQEHRVMLRLEKMTAMNMGMRAQPWH